MQTARFVFFVQQKNQESLEEYRKTSIENFQNWADRYNSVYQQYITETETVDSSPETLPVDTPPDNLDEQSTSE